MAEQAVQVVGLEQLQASLHRLARQAEGLAPPQAAAIIGRAAAARAPRRTGRLANSFASDSRSGQLLLSFGTPYAGAVHFGVGPRSGLRGPHNIRANPYLFGAIKDTESQWLGAYSDQLQSMVDEVKGA